MGALAVVVRPLARLLVIELRTGAIRGLLHDARAVAAPDTFRAAMEVPLDAHARAHGGAGGAGGRWLPARASSMRAGVRGPRPCCGPRPQGRGAGVIPLRRV